MNRRNFIKGLLAIGAGFSILPPATTYSRIWTVEKKVLLPEQGVDYIWNRYYMSWHLTNTLPTPNVGEGHPWGSVEKINGRLWYRYSGGWVALEPKSRPTHYKPKQFYPAALLGQQNNNVQFENLWVTSESVEVVMPEIPDMELREPIPNIVAEMQPNGDTRFYTVS